MPAKKGKVTAVLSHRGGCGKTTTVVTLVSILNSLGKKVAVIDGDSNVAASKRLLSPKALEKTNNFYDLISRPKKYHWSDCCAHAEKYPNTVVIPGTMEMAEATPVLQRISLGSSPQKALIPIFKGIRSYFDHIIFDCSNGISVLNQAILTLSDRFLIPSDTTIDGLDSAETILRLAKGLKIKKDKFLGLLICGAPIYRKQKGSFEKKVKSFKDKVLTTRIPSAKDLASECGNERLTMYDTRKRHPMSKAYKSIADQYFI